MSEWQQGAQPPMIPGSQPVPGTPVAQPQPPAYPQTVAHPQPTAHPQQPVQPQQPVTQPEVTASHPEPPTGYTLTPPHEQAPDLPEPPPGFTLTPPDAQPQPGSASATPVAREINSVGVAIMPGVPLPEWIDQGQLAEILAPALDGAPQYPVAHPVPGFQTADGGVTAGTGLPLPNPVHRSEHPMGPVTWGTTASADQQQPMPAAVGAVASPAAASPSVDQFDWLLQPETPSYQRIPDYAPPPGTPAVPAPPAGYYLPAAAPDPAVAAQTSVAQPPAGYYLPAAAPAGADGAAVPVPPPPEGFYIAAEVNPDVPMGAPVPPPPEGYYVPDVYAAGEVVGAGSR